MIFICHKDRLYFYEYGGDGYRECPICHRQMDRFHGRIPVAYRMIPKPPTPQIVPQLFYGKP